MFNFEFIKVCVMNKRLSNHTVFCCHCQSVFTSIKDLIIIYVCGLLMSFIIKFYRHIDKGNNY